MKKILVTGGAGFIGSHLVRGLLKEGYEVRVVDDYSTGSPENLEEVKNDIEMIEASVASQDVAHKVCAGMDAVFHEAAIPSVPKSVADPLMTHETGVTATLMMLIASRDAGVKRFIQAASSSAYGETVDLPKVETITPQPLSPYAVSKLAGEYYASVFTSCYGLETLSLRYFNVFGPKQDPNSPYSAVIAKFCTLMLEGKTPTINGDGEQSRDFTYVDNVVAANIAALSADKLSGEVLNVGVGEQTTLNTLVANLNTIIGTDIVAINGPDAKGDVRHSLADLTRVREVIGYEPQVSFIDGLKKTVEWYKG